MIKLENEKNEKLNILGKKYNEVSLAYSQVLTNLNSMQEYDKLHPLDLSNNEEEKEEIKEKKISNKLTKEEERNIQGYENLLKRILKVFNILYLCKTKQEFINLMKKCLIYYIYVKRNKNLLI